VQAKHRERSLAGAFPVRASRNPGAQLVRSEQSEVDQPRGKLVLQARQQSLGSPGRGMPVRFCERSSADTGHPVDTKPCDWGRVPDSAYNRGKRLITGAGIYDDEKHRGGPIRLPLLEKRTQVLGLRLAGSRGRRSGHLERVVAVAEKDPLGFERHRRACWFGPGQAVPVIVLQEMLGILCWHPVLLISPGRLLP
jgi:hypothetical protein